MGWRWRWLIPLVLAVSAAGLTGCTTRFAIVAVHPVTTLADKALRIQITGLAAGERVELSAEAVDSEGEPWRSSATFVADGSGIVDLGAVAPVAGSYRGIDAMGLFWSMDPRSGRDDAASFWPFSEQTDGYDVTLSAIPDHSQLASAVVRRLRYDRGVRHRTLTLASDHVAGELYEPATATGPGVLLLGGSEGGISLSTAAALLASHGYPALALGYFALPGLPATLLDIPIEYVATAARLLPGPVRVIGYSRGTEAALLLSGLYPDLVRGTVVVATTDHVGPGFPGGGNAWTYQGLAQTTIPFERIVGPVLAVGGTDDQVWPSALSADAVARATGGERLLGLDAGHGVGALPFLATGTTIIHPVTGLRLDLGGNRPANHKAALDTWTHILALLARP